MIGPHFWKEFVTNVVNSSICLEILLRSDLVANVLALDLVDDPDFDLVLFLVEVAESSTASIDSTSFPPSKSILFDEFSSSIAVQRSEAILISVKHEAQHFSKTDVCRCIWQISWL